MRKEYIARLVKLINDKNLDGAFIAPSEEMTFFLGHSPILCERFQGFFITNKGEYFYVVNLISEAEMQEALGEEVKVYTWFDGEVFTDIVKKALEDYDLIGKTIAVNSSARAFNILEIEDKVDVKFVNGRPIFEEVRIIKSKEEIESLKKSSRIADEVFTELLEFIKPGIKEKDIQNKIYESFKEKGAQPMFAIVASGPNSALPHYDSNERVIQKRDVVLLDFGGIYENMFSDMTRTVFVGGVTEEERKIYELVLQANLAAESKVREGVRASEVDKAARDIIANAGYGKYFTTRLGHGIGYYVHEAPDIKESNPRELEKGMAFSIEPGIYLTGKFGVRIEDLVVLTENGIEIMNKAPKDLIVV